MKVLHFSLLLMLGLFVFTSCSSTDKQNEMKEVMAIKKQVEPAINYEDVSLLIKDWPKSSKTAANSMMSKYGLPKEVTPSMLLWEENGPFKRTIVFSEEYVHNFPFPHSDVLEQVINYQVPVSKVDELYQFNGSVVVERTRGELISRCDREEMNFLTLNLADEIIRGVASVKDARNKFSTGILASMRGHAEPLTAGLKFIPDSETADPDMATKEFRNLPSIQAEEVEQVEKAHDTMGP